MIRASRSSFAPLALLLVFEIAAIIGLQTLGSTAQMQVPWNDFSSWINSGQLNDIVPPLVRVTALAVAYWMFLSTALFVVAQISQIESAVRLTSLFTLPSVRRVVDGAMAVSIATTAVGGIGVTAAMAATPASVTSTTDAGSYSGISGLVNGTIQLAQADDSTTTTTATPVVNGGTVTIQSSGQDGWVATPKPGAVLEATTSTTMAVPTTAAPAVSTPTMAPSTTPTTKAPAAAAPAASTSTDASDHRVVAGENLWTISRAALIDSGNSSPTESQIRDYWLKVIDANTGSMRSSDPHWIFPGETVKLPAQ